MTQTKSQLALPKWCKKGVIVFHPANVIFEAARVINKDGRIFLSPSPDNDEDKYLLSECRRATPDLLPNQVTFIRGCGYRFIVERQPFGFRLTADKIVHNIRINEDPERAAAENLAQAFNGSITTLEESS